MSFLWSDYLDFSKILLNFDNLPENILNAKHRTILGRAYYAAYNSARQIIVDYCKIDYNSSYVDEFRRKYNIKSGGEHGLIPKLLMIADDPDMRRLGARLETLKSDRIKADYKLEAFNKLSDKAKKAIDKSEEIIKGLKSIQDGSVVIDIGQFGSN